MQAKYKIPGGKLVVVEFEASSDDKIVNFQLSGDFFLEPDEALGDIIAAVEGMPITSTIDELTRKIQGGLRAGTQMMGVSAKGIATTIRRAIVDATSWRDYDWQLIRTEPLSPVMHLALDDVLTNAVADGEIPPTLRIWNWNSPAVAIGSFQSVKNEVDAENAAKYGIPVIRRMSGGGAMFMEAGNVVTYALYVPEALVAGMTFEESYAFLDAWTVQALRELGVNAWYQPLNDITSAGGKIGGAAQHRLANGAVLHHVTMSYDIDAYKMVQVLRIGREKISDKGITSAKKRVDPLKSQTGMEREAIIDKMIEVFEREHGLSKGELKPEHLERAKALVESKYGTDEWLYRIP